MPASVAAPRSIEPAAGVRAQLKLMSFGFKYGLPLANYYFDVSFAVNPARDDRWGMHGVADHEMVEFVLSQPVVDEFIRRVVPLLEHVASLDAFQVAAFGCSSGRHRSPIIANEVARRLVGRHELIVEHRDLPEHDLFAYEVQHGRHGR
jgi:RNase adaptor protein for sRNA GlmZ degradation